ncbi:MAG: isopentenyl-diphosphate Delta-isomerase, partial [Nevskiales bacterium]
SCCGHPQPDEALELAAHRRLREEMGFECELKRAFQFHYKAALGNGLTEHEVDHVFLGAFNGRPQLNPAEADAWRHTSLEELKQALVHSPEHFTYWLRHSFQLLLDHIQQDPLQIAEQLGIRANLKPGDAG